ncbi:hypothetical protein EVAR_65187_1 [Eumeta japonica]|uniref:Uncharacterized protein n=1 Tax=Eumeta variegata TaxID=151549 RepID=A0A4C1ZGC8_EUMVA|nr:hypothetical protein EVAR_65187_1 [Eumeta japonica]
MRVGGINASVSANEYAARMTGEIERAAFECLGVYKNNSVRKYDSRSDRLDGLRHNFNRLRRRWQRLQTQPGQLANGAREEFIEARKRYRMAVREAQAEHFRGIAETGNVNPWGLAYRTASGRIRAPSNIINGIKFRGGTAGSVDDAIKNMLYALLPDDDVTNDTAYHQMVRAASSALPDGRPAPPMDQGLRTHERIGRKALLL